MLIKVTGGSAESAAAPRRARPSRCYNRHGCQSRLSPTLVISVTSRHLQTGLPVVRLTRRQRQGFPRCGDWRKSTYQRINVSTDGQYEKIRHQFPDGGTLSDSAATILNKTLNQPQLPSPGRSKLGGPPSPGTAAPSAGLGSSFGPTTASRVSLNFSKLSAEIT